MDTQSISSTPPQIGDLFALTLADGLKVEREGKELRYRVVRLRETGVADERKAERLSERAVQVGGAWKLLVSESNFKHVLNMLHIEAFVCDGQEIPQALIDIELYDKLSSRDLEMIEERIFLLTLASEVRYGNMTQAEFDNITAGIHTKPAVPQAPQRGGQAADVGEAPAQSQPGPALLADYVGDAAKGQAQGDGGPAL